MPAKKIDLNTCSLTLDEGGIVNLHLYKDQTINSDQIRDIFETIHKEMSEARCLLVTADEKATLDQEARDLVSQGSITEQIIADAIVPKHYSHQMAANFFVRYNQPQRPTKLFKTEEEAREWLMGFIN